jgi:hypothetical protein
MKKFDKTYCTFFDYLRFASLDSRFRGNDEEMVISLKINLARENLYSQTYQIGSR